MSPRRSLRSPALTTLAAAASALLVALPATAADTTAGPCRWVGSTNADGTVGTSWFDPSSWSTGQVPGAGDDVELDGDDDVRIDAAGRGAVVAFRDLHVRDDARLEVVGGAIVVTRQQVLHDRGQIIHRSSGDLGDALTVAPTGCSGCVRIVLNPTAKSKRVVDLQSSVTVDVGLGGTTPASLTTSRTGELVLAAGRGHYSTLTADRAALAGTLRLSTYYGFAPAPGDRFQVLTATERTGQFDGLPEGSLVSCTEDGVGLRISYRGGDGNDVVLAASAADRARCLLLPAVQRIREVAVPRDRR